MSLLTVENVTHGFGARQILENTSFRLLKGEGMTIREVLRTAFDSMYSLEQDMLKLYEDMSTADESSLNDMMEEAGEIQQMLESSGFYQLDSKIEEVAGGLGLTDIGLDRDVADLSGGQRTKVLLVKLLLENPSILILDEPTNGLDPSGIHEIRNLIKSLPDLYDCTVLISSHMLSEIELIADDIGILNHGRLLFEGSLDDLRQHALQSGFATDNLEDMFLSMVEKDNASRKQRAKL